MSRIGKLPIHIPQNVQVNFSADLITVEGPKGTLMQKFDSLIKFEKSDSIIRVLRSNDSKKAKSLHGLYNRLLNNMVIGVSTGFEKVLLINGVGYRAELIGSDLTLNLGYSNPIIYKIPEGLEIQVEAQTKIVLRSIYKDRLGQAAADIRSLRPVEPYKGKGIYYENEYIRKKVGKAGIK